MKPPLHERVQLLVDYVYPAGESPYTLEEIERLTSKERIKLPAEQMRALLSGEQTDPSGFTLRGMSRFFKVPIEFFTTEDAKEWNGYVTFIKRLREEVDSTNVYAARVDTWFERRRNRRSKRK